MCSRLRYRRRTGRDNAVDRGSDKMVKRNEPLHTTRWRKIRDSKLGVHPLCERCERYGRDVLATVVHHIDKNERNNRYQNLESLCRDCHEKEHRRKADTGCDVNGIPTSREHHWRKDGSQ